MGPDATVVLLGAVRSGRFQCLDLGLWTNQLWQDTLGGETRHLCGRDEECEVSRSFGVLVNLQIDES